MKLVQSKKHSRTLWAQDLPVKVCSDYSALEINIQYNGEGNACKDFALDHHVIPQIVRACNAHEQLVAENAELRAELEQLKGISAAIRPSMKAQLVAALEKIDANAAESAEWIRNVTRQALAAAKGQP